MAAELATTTGTLFKWTNYVQGWQPRYFILKNGILMYHKSEHETAFGCRGAIAVKASTFSLHEFDFCRFNVGVCDYVWYLRASTKEERDKWILALEEQTRAFDQELLNLQSTHNPITNNVTGGSNNETNSNTICYNNLVDLPEPLHSLQEQQQKQQQPQSVQEESILSTKNQQETSLLLDPPPQPQQELQHLQYSDNFCDAQEHFEDPISDISDIPTVDQSYHPNNQRDLATDTVIQKDSKTSVTMKPNELNSIEAAHNDHKNRIDHSIILKHKQTNGHTVELHQSPTGARQSNPQRNNSVCCNTNNNNSISSASAHSITDDNNSIVKNMTNNNNSHDNLINDTNSIAKLPEPNNPLWPKIDQLTKDQLYYAQIGLGQEGTTDGWQLFAEDGQMRLYTRELEIDGLVCDPLKAVHVVKGISGFEMCHRFFSPSTRFEWEQTLESMKVIEEINKDTLIFHQVHKRIWPAAQRDAVFWSHIRQIDNPKSSCLSRDDINTLTRPDLKLHSVWIVCNNSIDKPEITLGNCVRIRLTVSLVCETYIPVNSSAETVRREDLTCKIIYSSTINPGGWAPAAILRAVYKKEYPKFLDSFSSYVIASTKSKPIVFE